MFKSIDKKFEEIGFKKLEEDKYGVVYERINEEFNFVQTLSILHKQSGMHIVQSYDKTLFDGKHIGNTCVGITMYEIKLCYKKMKKMGWKMKKHSGVKNNDKRNGNRDD